VTDEDRCEHDELMLKQPYWTSAVVDERLRAVFSSADVMTASVMLAGLMGEDPGGDPEVSDLATCRLMLAALKVSGGDPLKLALWVEAAHGDPRDLIAAAEYHRQVQGGDESARQADLSEYLAWLRG